MEDKTIPYLMYEATQARHERTLKRLIIALIIVTAMMFASNVAWLYVWQSYEYCGEETTVTQDGYGLNNFNTGMQGAINN